MRLLFWLSLALVMGPGGKSVWAHSWYPYDCCSDRDCWPMGVDSDAREPDPAVVPGGYRTHDGIFVAERDTRPSKDGRFHVCRYGGGKEAGVITTRQGICLFVPQPTF